MRNQVRQFVRVLVDDLKDTASEAAEPLGAALGITLLLAISVGVLYLLGWGVAALMNGGPTTVDDRGIAAVLIFGVGFIALFAYVLVRDLRRWMLRLWHAAQREVP